MKLLVIGGDGYLGWPTAMYFSRRGHDVAVFDSGVKRVWEAQLGAYPLVPVADWRAALSAKRVKARSSAGRSEGKTSRKDKTGTASASAGERSRRAEGATGAAPAASTATSAPSVKLTPELRAQHRIPDWADGSDLSPGEALEKYALRKRVEGPPHDPNKFIGG